MTDLSDATARDLTASLNRLDETMRQVIVRWDAKRAPKGAKPDKYGPEHPAMELATLLFGALRETHQALIEPNMQAWALAIDRMLIIDKRDPEQVRRVIMWLPSDVREPDGGNEFPGWGFTVQSAGTLRKKFDKIASEMNRRTSQRTMAPKPAARKEL